MILSEEATEFWGNGYLEEGCMGRIEWDDTTYIGEMKGLIPHGQGTIKSIEHKCSWTGRFDREFLVGEGILTLEDGTTKNVTFPENTKAFHFCTRVEDYL